MCEALVVESRYRTLSRKNITLDGELMRLQIEQSSGARNSGVEKERLQTAAPHPTWIENCGDFNSGSMRLLMDTNPKGVKEIHASCSQGIPRGRHPAMRRSYEESIQIGALNARPRQYAGNGNVSDRSSEYRRSHDGSFLKSATPSPDPERTSRRSREEATLMSLLRTKTSTSTGSADEMARY